MFMRAMRLVSLAMAALFVYSVAVQYNDPDPIIWMAIYGGAALFSILCTFRRIPFALLLVYGLVSLIWAATIAPLVIGKQSLIDSEEGREMLGLLLVTVWSFVVAAFVRRQSREKSGAKPV